MNEEKYLSIEAITKYLKYKFDTDTNLKSVFLKGEISNFKAHSSGHWYFSLKDEKSKINAIMFKAASSKVGFKPEEGTNVLVAGRISVYEATGGYQIYVDEMLEDGVGSLYLEFEKLKKKLGEKGYFDDRFKKPLPKVPFKIGVVTAATGAAIKDITSTIKRRFPVAEVILFPALVQGENASKSIVEKINQAQNFQVDLLIVGRGGGSIEDLWPFNEENVAEAIFNSKIPIISAVGHEVDYTIADFVADLRAPTPTGAAEMAVPDVKDLNMHISNYKLRLIKAINKSLSFEKLNMEKIKNSFVLKNPSILYENKKQILDVNAEKLKNTIHQSLKIKKERLSILKSNKIFTNPKLIYKEKQTDFTHLLEKLEIINPLSVLKRGYSVTYKEDKILKSIKQIKTGDLIGVKLSDGTFNANIIKVEEN